MGFGDWIGRCSSPLTFVFLGFELGEILSVDIAVEVVRLRDTLIGLGKQTLNNIVVGGTR